MRRGVSFPAAVAVALLLACCVPVVAQEADADDLLADDDELDLFGIYAEASIWITRPNGLGFRLATEQDPVSGITGIDSFDIGTLGEDRYRLAYEFPGGNSGGLIGTYWGFREDYDLTMTNTGTFQFGGLQAYSTFAGANDDGQFDGFAATAEVVTRDVRIEYYKDVIKDGPLTVTWMAGFRRVQHNVELSIDYLTLSNPDIDAESVFRESRFTGRGLNSAVEVEYEFTKRWQVEGGLAIAALFGDTDVRYESNPTQVTDPGPPLVVSNPILVGFEEENLSTSVQIGEVHLGIRATIWRQIEAFAHYRLATYQGIQLDALPVANDNPTITNDLAGMQRVNVDQIDETTRDITYEGVQFGLAITF